MRKRDAMMEARGERERERFEDITLLALTMEEGDTSQGTWQPPEARKGKEQTVP